MKRSGRVEEIVLAVKKKQGELEAEGQGAAETTTRTINIETPNSQPSLFTSLFLSSR